MKTNFHSMFGLLVTLLVFSPCVVFAQFNIPHIGNIGNLPGIGDVIGGIPGLGGGEYEEPLTTNINDAVTEVPFLDDYNPHDYKHLIPIPGVTGRYHRIPGRWFFPAESYCLHAGTHGPTQGDGYVVAPLKGPLAGVVHRILSNSAGHPEIEQNTIQSLIWGLESRTKISDMDGGCQQAAQALLTAADIGKLNGGSLGVVPPEMLNQVFSQVSLPPALREVMEAETRIRTLMSSGNSTYSQLESLAVLPGSPTEPDVRDVPAERWSYHPDGYFVRYEPNGYPSTDIFLSIPDYYTVTHDQLGRIASVVDSQGNSVAVSYDGSIAALSQGGGPVGYAFSNIEITMNGASSTYPNAGWAMTSVPSSANVIDAGRYNNASTYAQWSIQHKSQVTQLCSQVPPSDGTNGLIEETIQLGLLEHGVGLALDIDRNSANGPEKMGVELLRGAWMRNTLGLLRNKPTEPGSTGWGTTGPGTGPGGPGPEGPGDEGPGTGPGDEGPGVGPGDEGPGPGDEGPGDEGPGPGDEGPGDEGPGSDMSGGDSGSTACPANTGAQRLGIGNRPRDGGNDNPQTDNPDDQTCHDDTPFDDPPTCEPGKSEFAEGQAQGQEDGWKKGFQDGQAGNDPGWQPPLPPLDPDPQWNQGYSDGYDSGYNNGYNSGKPFHL
jgi:hypothetical protein